MLEIPNRPLSMGLRKYIAEAGALGTLGRMCAARGRKAYVIGGRTALSKASAALEKSLAEAGVTYEICATDAFCSEKHINRLKEEAAAFDPDVLVGVGGGSILDTVKAVAFYMQLPTIAVATVATNCAAWAPLSILYTDDHEPIIGLDTYAPEYVVCDYDIIFENPKRFLAAGLGDSLAKWPELRTAAYQPPYYATSMEMARYLYGECLRLAKAMTEETDQRKHIADGVDYVIPITGLISELTAGAMGGNALALIAHGVDNGLLAATPKSHSFLHGERVSFGIIPHMLIKNHPGAEIEAVLDFNYSLGLPLELEDFGLDESIIPRLAEKTHFAPGISENNISAGELADTFREYRRMVKAYKTRATAG